MQGGLGGGLCVRIPDQVYERTSEEIPQFTRMKVEGCADVMLVSNDFASVTGIIF